tara:strand:- start:189 stop:488 length:300 start_codon:yes stop_codon:yes gene_type:complete
MKIIEDNGATFRILVFPNEVTKIGDFLRITDKQKRRSSLVQIIDKKNIGDLELLKILKNMNFFNGENDDIDNYYFLTSSNFLKKAKLLTCILTRSMDVN